MGEECMRSHGEGKQDAGLEEVPLAGSRPAHFFSSRIHVPDPSCIQQMLIEYVVYSRVGTGGPSCEPSNQYPLPSWSSRFSRQGRE